MYEVGVIQILHNQTPPRAMIYMVEQSETKMIPLNELHESHNIIGTFIQNNDTYLILKSLNQDDADFY